MYINNKNDSDKRQHRRRKLENGRKHPLLWKACIRTNLLKEAFSALPKGKRSRRTCHFLMKKGISPCHFTNRIYCSHCSIQFEPNLGAFLMSRRECTQTTSGRDHMLYTSHIFLEQHV